MGRICLVLPLLLTLGTLISLLLVFIGNVSPATPTTPSTHSLHFLNITTTSFQFRSQLHTSDWYTIGLWNYCRGARNSTTPTYCSPHKAFYHFDPLAAWGITGTIFENAVPASWRTGLNAYYKTSQWMWWGYICAAASTGAAVLLGSLTCCLGRTGSLLATVAAWVSLVCTVAASALATALFLTLRTFVTEKLGGYHVSASLGHAIFVVTWIGVAFALAAALTWIVNLCCCGGGHGCCCGGGARGRDGGGAGKGEKRAVGRGTVYVRVPEHQGGGWGAGGLGAGEDGLGGGGRKGAKNTWFGQGSKDVQLQTRAVDARYEGFRR